MCHYGAPAPNLSADLLWLGIGYRLQEQKLGRVSRASRSLLRQVTAQAVTTGLADLLEDEYALRSLNSLDHASDLIHKAQPSSINRTRLLETAFPLVWSA